MLLVSWESKDFLRNSFLNQFCARWPVVRLVVGTEHRDYADFAMVRLFRGLPGRSSTAMHRYSANNRIEHQCYRVTASNLLAPSRSLV